MWLEFWSRVHALEASSSLYGDHTLIPRCSDARRGTRGIRECTLYSSPVGGSEETTELDLELEAKASNWGSSKKD